MKTTEEKAKAYDEAIEKLRSLHDNYDTVSTLIDIKEELEYIFPELRESEDEKIRKMLIDSFTRADMGGEIYGKGVTYKQVIAWLEKQSTPQDKGEISDGYHTFNELYYYRMLYNAAFFNMLPKEWVHKSKKHHDGEDCFGGGWFIVMANLPTGQVSNHYELKDWDLFQIPEKEVADEWDGHTPQEAADRLHKYLLKKQGEQNSVTCEDWLKFLRSKSWTKKDKERFISCLQRLGSGNPEQPETINSKWFKEHVYPQKQWKPSDAQMSALYIATHCPDLGLSRVLKTLYNDLDKLK